MINSALINKGSFKCVEDANGKYIEATAVDSQFSLVQPHAYGTWEFSFTATRNPSTGFSFINSNSSIGSDFTGFGGYGYSFHMGWDVQDRVHLIRCDGVSSANLWVSPTSSVTFGTWYDAKITRDTLGKFTVYLRSKTDARYPTWTIPGSSFGTNPITNNTYTTSNFAVFDADSTNKISNFRHYQGVEV